MKTCKLCKIIVCPYHKGKTNTIVVQTSRKIKIIRDFCCLNHYNFYSDYKNQINKLKEQEKILWQMLWNCRCKQCYTPICMHNREYKKNEEYYCFNCGSKSRSFYPQV